MNINKIITATLALSLTIALSTGCSGLSKSQNPGTTMAGEPYTNEKTSGSLNASEDIQSLEIVCTGDIMVHDPQIPAQYFSSKKKYDFNNNFQYIKKYLEKADLAIGNFEGTFGGKPYVGYPLFSAPDELAIALKNAGYDLIITANNHMVDRRDKGVIRTLKKLREQGMETTGSRLNKSEPRYSISNVKGINVGTVAYTYETGAPRKDGTVFINGINTPLATAELINSFSYKQLDKSIAKIEKTLDEAIDAGSQIQILYLHFGEEYHRAPSDYQKKIVNYFVNSKKVDIIFASHPHVIQEAKYVTSKDKSKKVPVFFSMGNFISNQREETLQNRYTEQGMIARVNLDFDKNGKKITSIKMGATPTWVDRYTSSSRPVYEIIPLDKELKNNPALRKSGHLSRAKQALKDINKMLPKN